MKKVMENINKYLMLAFTDKSKDTMTKHEELWSKIRNSISSITNNSDNYDIMMTNM